MKSLIFAGVLLLSQSGPAELIGEWKYIAYQFNGQTQPLPNPSLDLKFTFEDTGKVRLRWSYKDEEGFCDRLASFEVRQGGWVFQKVYWVNPENHISCARDADMQMGSESLTHFRRQENRLMLDLELGGEPFIYILEQISENSEKRITK